MISFVFKMLFQWYLKALERQKWNRETGRRGLMMAMTEVFAGRKIGEASS